MNVLLLDVRESFGRERLSQHPLSNTLLVYFQRIVLDLRYTGQAFLQQLQIDCRIDLLRQQRRASSIFFKCRRITDNHLLFDLVGIDETGLVIFVTRLRINLLVVDAFSCGTVSWVQAVADVPVHTGDDRSSLWIRHYRDR
ncbi:hypothetical protein D3C87_1364340 [compost metagenome]